MSPLAVGQTMPTADVRVSPGQSVFHGDGDDIAYDHTMNGDAGGSFDIQVNFQDGLTPSQQAIFSSAELFWESALTGYRPGISLNSVSISARGVAIDGVGKILGSAGPTTTTNQDGLTLATAGAMRFDTADLDNLENGGSLQDVILHEMAHVLGFGTLWDFGLNDVYVDGSGEYTGTHAVAAYKTEFNQLGASSVPVELGGAAGTANGHWNEVNNGAGLTGIADPQNRDLRNELMTGWLNSPTFVSRMTVQSFGDLGFAVVPEPNSIGLVLLGAMSFSLRRRRRLSPWIPAKQRAARPRHAYDG